jgi:predicted ATPase
MNSTSRSFLPEAYSRQASSTSTSATFRMPRQHKLFQSLIRPLLSKKEEDLRKWRDTLRDALDPNGPLIIELVPELKHIIGEQPPVPELPPQEAQRRFQLVFRRFIGVFARPEHPLALFLDDLQWLDAATLDLLEDLLTGTDLQHLLRKRCGAERVGFELTINADGLGACQYG